MSRVVIVTGSSRGIGLALARACALRGDRVVVHGRDAARVAEALDAIRPDRRDLVGIVADLARSDGAQVLVDGALAAFGRIDVLVNNAGTTTPRAPLWEIAATELDDVVATNLAGPMQCARAVLAWAVREQQPVRIVNVSSGAVALPPGGAAGYVATKAGLEGFTRALARDVGEGIVVTAIALGGHRTAMAKSVLPEAEYEELPPPEAAVAALELAITAPPEQVHGRILGEPVERALATDGADAFALPNAVSPRARAALAEVAATGALERYPEPPSTLRKVIAAKFGVALDAVVLGGGTAELFERVMRVAVQPGEAIVANDPTWPLIPHACRARRVAWRRVPYRLTRGLVDHDLDGILAAIDRSVHLVYLTSPANPVAATLATKAFRRFLDQVPRHVTIVVDEAYGEFVTREDALVAPSIVRSTDRNVVALRTFSKFYGLAGLRVGYAIAPPAFARRLARSAPPFPLVRGAEEAALAALADGEHAKRTLARVAQLRAAMTRDFAARGIEHLESEAPFVLAADPDAPGPRFFDRFALVPLAERAT